MNFLNILYSSRQYGGAEVYVRFMQETFGIDFVPLQSQSYSAFLTQFRTLLSVEKTLICHDLRASIIGLLFYIFLRKKIILVIHGPGKRAVITRSIIKTALLLRLRVVLVGSGILNNPKRNKYLYQIENISRFDSCRSQFIEEKPKFCFIGRVDKSKKVDKLCDLWETSFPLFELNIYGGGPLKDALISRFQNSQNIHIRGEVTASEVEGILQKHTHYISLSIREGLSLSLLEAISLGVVPIVSRIPSQYFLESEMGIKLLEPDSSNILQVVSELTNMTKEEMSTVQDKMQKYTMRKHNAWITAWNSLLNYEDI